MGSGRPLRSECDGSQTAAREAVALMQATPVLVSPVGARRQQVML